MLNDEDVFFWGVHTGAELDLVFRKNGKMWGIEVKYNESPGTTKSIYSAMSELNLEHVFLIYPGTDSYPFDNKITAVGINNINQLSELLKNKT